jgi:hypothetical protein
MNTDRNIETYLTKMSSVRTTLVCVARTVQFRQTGKLFNGCILLLTHVEAEQADIRHQAPVEFKTATSRYTYFAKEGNREPIGKPGLN